jgi:hypothetical protein
MSNHQQQKTLVIQGIFNKAGDSLLELKKPILYNRTLAKATPSIAKGIYSAVISYQDGQSVVVPFNALASDDSGRKAFHGFFELQIPVREGITSIKICRTESNQVLAVIKPEGIQRDP